MDIEQEIFGDVQENAQEEEGVDLEWLQTATLVRFRRFPNHTCPR